MTTLGSDPVNSDVPTLGLTLSGGGHRATLFSLGALLAADEAQTWVSISWISSVSGGSIANAVYALHPGRNDMPNREFLTECRERVRLLSRRSAPFVRGRSQVAAVIWAVTLLSVLYLLGNTLVSGGISIGSVGLLCAVLGVFRARGRLLEIALDDLWLRPRGKRSPRIGGNDVPPPDDQSTHIFCATDLVAGKPVYFGTWFVAADRNAWMLRSLPLRRVVRASASFPGLLPPVRVRFGRFAGEEFSNVWQRLNRPDDIPRQRSKGRRWMLLTDGGVFNNLGSQWDTAGRFHDHDGLLLPGSVRSEVSILVVADAGKDIATASSLVYAIPILGPLLAMLRVTSTSYAAGLGAERSRLQAATWQMPSADSPSVRLVEMRTRPRFATSAPEDLVLTSSAWRIFAATTRECRTHLFRVSESRAVRMIAHGYAHTITQLIDSGVPAETFGSAWREWLHAAVLADLPESSRHRTPSLDFNDKEATAP